MPQPYSLHTLSNGLRMIHLPLANEPSVFVSLIGKVGRRAELDSEVGAAHFLEHLFFDGTERFPSAHDLATFIDGKGTMRNGTTGPEEVRYFVRILPENVESAFDYVSDITMHSLLKEEDIEKERKVIKQEALSNSDKVDQALGRLHRNILFPGHALGRNIFDEAENLPNMNRSVLTQYMQRTYTSGNFILAVAGAIDESSARSLAEQYFARFPQGQETPFEPARIPDETVIKIHTRDVQQSHLIVSHRAFPFQTDEALLTRLLAAILGGGSSSRLQKHLRHDLHLVYAVHAMTTEHADTGLFHIQTSLEEANIQAALTAIREEIVRLTTTRIDEEELEKAKNMLLARALFNLDNIVPYTNFYADQALYHRPIMTIDDFHSVIRGATPERLQALAQEIFADAPKMTVITKSLTDITF